MDAEMKESFNTRMRVTIGIKDLKLQNGYFMDTQQQKEENVDFWYMRMQFARVFLLFCSLGMFLMTVTDFSKRSDTLNKYQVCVLSINLVQVILTILYIIGSFYSKNLLKHIKYGLYC